MPVSYIRIYTALRAYRNLHKTITGLFILAGMWNTGGFVVREHKTGITTCCPQRSGSLSGRLCRPSVWRKFRVMHPKEFPRTNQCSHWGNRGLCILIGTWRRKRHVAEPVQGTGTLTDQNSPECRRTGSAKELLWVEQAKCQADKVEQSRKSVIVWTRVEQSVMT